MPGFAPLDFKTTLSALLGRVERRRYMYAAPLLQSSVRARRLLARPAACARADLEHAAQRSMAASAELDIPSALLELPSHLVHLILQFLKQDVASLVSACRSCRSLLAAVSDARLWPSPAASQTGGLVTALSSELALAALLPQPLLAPRLLFSPHSRFQASLTLAGLRAALQHTHPHPARPPPPHLAAASMRRSPAAAAPASLWPSMVSSAITSAFSASASSSLEPGGGAVSRATSRPFSTSAWSSPLCWACSSRWW